MSITFQCRKCNNEVTAPDSAAGKKGRCPFCGHVSQIPAPVEEDDVIPLAPIDEDEEHRTRQVRRALYEQEQDLLAATGGDPLVPLDHRDDLISEDLHHFVVNYCLDMAEGKLDRAQVHVERLRQFGHLAAVAVDDFLSGHAAEPAMSHIPQPVLQGLLKELIAQVR